MVYQIKGEVSVEKGLILPNYTTAELVIYSAIASEGTTAYDTDLKLEMIHNGTEFVPHSGAGGVSYRGPFTTNQFSGIDAFKDNAQKLGYSIDTTAGDVTLTITYSNDTGDNAELEVANIGENEIRVVTDLADTFNNIAAYYVTKNSVVRFKYDIANNDWVIVSKLNYSDAEKDRVFETTNQIAHGHAQASLPLSVYNDGTSWLLTDGADNSKTAHGIITNIVDVDNFEVTTFGVAAVVAHGLTDDNYYWLGADATGVLTDTTPTTGVSQSLLYIRDVNTIFVKVEQPTEAVGVGLTTSPLVRESVFDASMTTKTGAGGTLLFNVTNPATGAVSVLDGKITRNGTLATYFFGLNFDQDSGFAIVLDSIIPTGGKIIALSAMADNGTHENFSDINLNVTADGRGFDVNRDNAIDADVLWKMRVEVDGYPLLEEKNLILPNSVEVDLTGVVDGDSLMWDAPNTKLIKGTGSQYFESGSNANGNWEWNKITNTLRQWGVVTIGNNATHNYPVLFDNDSVTVVATIQENNANRIVGINQVVSAGFRVVITDFNGSGGYVIPTHWQAIGPKA